MTLPLSKTRWSGYEYLHDIRQAIHDLYKKSLIYNLFFYNLDIITQDASWFLQTDSQPKQNTTSY